MELVAKAGYRATYCPLSPEAADAAIQSFSQAALEADIVIAEVGAWSNPIAWDDVERKKAIEHCQRSLSLADRVGANCCVNIAGSRGEKWDGPDPENLSGDTFALIVDTIRAIIDAVKPTRTAYALETMPWIFPHSVSAYLDLIKAIDRPAFGVHLDVVNLVLSPEIYFDNRHLIAEAIEKLGPHIRSIHAKDIILRENLTVHLDETPPGLGGIDYHAYFRLAKALPDDLPIMLEHLSTPEEYTLAADHLRKVAAEVGMNL